MHSEDTVGSGGFFVEGVRSNNTIHLTLSVDRITVSKFEFQYINP